MPRIDITTLVRAPIGLVFDLARSMDAHQESQRGHWERAIAGRTSGLIEEGETVTWEAVHFGIRQRLSSRITRMTRPAHFRDSMLSGAFSRFDHDHFFEERHSGETMMRDVFDYTSPCGLLGRMVDGIILKRYMTRLLLERNDVIRRMAESATYHNNGKTL